MSRKVDQEMPPVKLMTASDFNKGVVNSLKTIDLALVIDALKDIRNHAWAFVIGRFRR